MKRLVILCILLLLLIPYTYAEEETYIIVVLEDGTIEKRLTSEFIPEANLFRMASLISPVDEAINSAMSQEGIVYAEEIYPLKLEAVSPNSGDDGWRFDAVQLTDILSTLDFSLSDVRVAVLDSGLNYSGVDLTVEDPKDVSTSSTTDTIVTSNSDHGTHVAGIIGAKLDGDDIDGIAPGVTIVPVKVFTDTGVGDTSMLIRGLEYVIELNTPTRTIDVVNMSLSYSSYSQVISDLIDDLEAQGVVVVAATGNDSDLWLDGSDYNYFNDPNYAAVMNYPAGFETVLAVGSVSKSDTTLLGISDFSNVAGIPTGLSVKTEVDVIAPGEFIASWTDTTSTAYMSGTSMASPHVAGLAAILMDEYPLLTPSQIRYLIRTTSKEADIEVPTVIPTGKTRSDLVGSGIIQVNDALNFSPIQSISFDDVSDFIYDPTSDSFTGKIAFDIDDVEMTVTLLDTASYKIDSALVDANLVETITTTDTTTTFVLNSIYSDITRSQTIVLTKEVPQLLGVQFLDGVTDLEYIFDTSLDEQFVIIDKDVTDVTLVSDAGIANIFYDGSLTASTTETFTMGGDVTVLIKVESSDQLSSKTYTLHLVKDKEALSLTDLQAKIDSDPIATVAGFGSYTLSYALGDIANDIDPVISAVSGSTVEYSLNDGTFETTLDLSSIENDIEQTVKIKVTDGDYYKTYTVTFTRLGSSRIEDITLTAKDGLDDLVMYSSYTFDENTTDYTIDVSYRMSDLQFDFVKNTEAATVEVFLNEEQILTPLEENLPLYLDSQIFTRSLAIGTHTLRIETTYNAVTSIYNYTINVMDLTDLSEIYLKADEVNILSFDDETSAYNYVVLDTTLDMTFKAERTEKSYGDMTISYDSLVDEAYDTGDIIDLDYGAPESITLKITSPIVSESKTYTFDVTERAIDSNTNLSSLSLSSQSLSPAFVESTYSYNLAVDNTVSSVVVNATKESSLATMKIDGQEITSLTVSLAVGTNTVNIVVTAEDLSSQTYVVTITRAAAPEPDPEPVTPPSGGSSGASSGGSSPAPTPPPPVVAEDQVETIVDESGVTTEVVSVSDDRVEEDILDDTLDIIEVVIEETDSAEVGIDESILTLLQENDKPLEISIDDVTFVLDQEVMNGLRVSEQLNISFETASDEHKDQKVVSKIYELNLYDGESKLSFDVPIPIVLTYDTGSVSNRNNLAVYFYDENQKTWVYAGGKILSSGKISFEARHFSEYTIRENSKTFDDIQNHWGKSAIETIASREITKGISENEFAPDKSLTNAEFVVLLVKVLGLSDSNVNVGYPNIIEGSWYEPFFKKAIGADLLSGSYGITLDPNAPIKREEMASLLMDAYFYYSNTSKGDLLVSAVEFADDEDAVSQHFRTDVRMTYQLGLIVGDNLNNFNPQNGATRAEAAVVIKKLLILLDLL